MQVNTSAPNQKGAICFYAGPTAGQKGGMNFTATSTTPPLFGPGTVELVQIITPIEDYMTNAVPSVKVPDPEDSKIGLDTHYPKTGPVYVEGGQPYQTNDSPAFGLANDVKSIVMQHSVTDYLMYEPPGSTQFVPLATFSWSTNGSATIPPSNNWADYATTHGSDSAGTVTPSSQTNFQVGNTFPSWTRVNVFPGF